MHRQIPISTCSSKEEAQALATFLWNEKERHMDDIVHVLMDLAELKQKWDVEPSKERKFVIP